MNDSPWIISATDDTFQQDVIERSKNQLVILDFWAEWCGPCRLLGPILERLAEEAAGQFTLVKANTEEAPQTAGVYRVASIPTVLAILDGQVIDAFEGALPENHIRQWLAKLSVAQQLKEILQSAEKDVEAAIVSLQNLRAANPRNDDLSQAMLKLLWQYQKTDECQQLLDELERNAPLEPEAQKIRSALSLQANAAIDIDAARKRALADPQDWSAQLNLAKALVGQEELKEAFDICLNLVMLDRKNTGEQARELMVEVFQASPDAPLTSEYRRKLGSALY